ncbi:MAG TPA: nitroreductase family deazaflavin-dependent oxidoreductase [Candidatus Limnocylindrales bacterium]|nr:nitroreductase family deazaflavin-dependent oxidoreductase [Candidatus Limnocylindrales bacterium]
MSQQIGNTAGAPWWVTVFNPVARRVLATGVPLGFNGLITICGRKSGLPRTTPIAIIDASGRRWIWSPWGDVHWVRNLRVAGRATITVRGRNEDVAATELDPTQRVEFFRDVLGPVARDMRFGVWFIRTVDGTDLDDPVKAAEGRAVFELHSR